MKFFFLLRVIFLRRELLKRDTWSQKEVSEHALRARNALVKYALAKCRFYRARLQALTWSEFPIISKSDVMQEFDNIVTERGLSKQAAQDFMAGAEASGRLLGRYEVAATSGTSGLRGLFPVTVNEWVTIIASYSRSYAWAGLRPNLLRRKRMAVISTTKPWHQSARVGNAVRSRFVPTLRLDATEDADRLVAKLNEFQPQSLVGYPSIIRVLAARQREGTLRIAPEVVMCSSERLTTVTRTFIEEAFATRVFNVYGATETATIASECQYHTMHLFEDLVHVEVIDDEGNALPDGQIGRVIVTPLFYKTLPLLRYDIGDKIAIGVTQCRCGRPYRAILNLLGRDDDTFVMTSRTGNVMRFHSNLINDLIESYPVEGWRVVVSEDRMLINIQSQDEPMVLAIESAIRQTLTQEPWSLSNAAIIVERVTALSRGSTGKTRRFM